MKALTAALMLALTLPALPVAADTLPGLHALTQGQAVERRAKRCPKGGETSTAPACTGHGGGGI